MSTTNKKSGTRNKNKDEQLFSEGQLRQLATLMKYTIQETVPPMIKTAIEETVPPMIEKIVDKKLKPFRREAIKHGWDLSPDEDE